MFDISSVSKMQMHTFKPRPSSLKPILCFSAVPAFSAPALETKSRCICQKVMPQSKLVGKGQLLRAEMHRDRRRSNPVTSYADDRESANRLPTQGESIVRGSGDDEQYGVQVMERAKPPADIDYLAVCLHPYEININISFGLLTTFAVAHGIAMFLTSLD